MKLTSRFYESEQDLRQMQQLLMEARSRTDDWRYMHIGEFTFRFFMVFCHLDPQKHIRLWPDATGRLVGYAILGEDPSFDWQVVPEYERCLWPHQSVARRDYTQKPAQKDPCLLGDRKWFALPA